MKQLTATRLLPIILLTVFMSVTLVRCHSPNPPAAGAFIPHASINSQEFDRQYGKNSAWWDKAFKFLKTQELDTLAPGTYIIDSGNVIATVSQGPPKELAQVNWEAHRAFNDLQYIIKGKVQMGISPVANPGAVVKVPYDPKTDTENFTVTGEKYYEAAPGTYFIFSPLDIHRPAIKVDGYDTIKKIVIKVRVP